MAGQNEHFCWALDGSNGSKQFMESCINENVLRNICYLSWSRLQNSFLHNEQACSCATHTHIILLLYHLFYKSLPDKEKEREKNTGVCSLKKFFLKLPYKEGQVK